MMSMQKKFTFVCAPGCTKCCTHNILISTLEGFYILSYLGDRHKSRLLEKLVSSKYLRPTLTPNEVAHYCLRGIEPPTEDNTFIIAPCPLLDGKMCPIYEVRPFNCRSFFLKKDVI
jgi:Fe-S-cluster containining protein